jgi:hypothetical protein
LLLLGLDQVLPAAEEQVSSKKSLTATAKIAELEQQIKAITADIAQATADRLAIDGQIEQLDLGEITDSILQRKLEARVNRDPNPDRDMARNSAINQLMTELNKDKDTLNTAIHDLREEKNLLLGKSPGGGAAAAAGVCNIFVRKVEVVVLIGSLAFLLFRGPCL